MATFYAGAVMTLVTNSVKFCDGSIVQEIAVQYWSGSKILRHQNSSNMHKITTLLFQATCSIALSVAAVQTGVLANFPNKLAKITGKFENVDESKNQGVFCQHKWAGLNVAVLCDQLHNQLQYAMFNPMRGKLNPIILRNVSTQPYQG